MTNATGRQDGRPWILRPAGGTRRPLRVPGVIEMQRGHRLTHPSALEMPDGFDPCGIPYVDSGSTRTPTQAAPSHRRHPRQLPGLPPTSLVASVEDVAVKGDGDWLVWGCVGNRPAMFAVEAGAAAEMMDSVTRGEMATAIIEPWQLVLERLD